MDQGIRLQGISHVLAIASGKGGVGKTTVSVNLALALAQAGARAGLFDAEHPLVHPHSGSPAAAAFREIAAAIAGKLSDDQRPQGGAAK